MVIAKALSEGDPRSLGRAEEVVQLVLDEPRRVGELFACLFSGDEIVRFRASDALEKVCRTRPDLLTPFTERLLVEVPKIDQPSVQWHLAQILSALPLDGRDRRRAVAVLKHNLYQHDDWIVVNLTLEVLATFVRQSGRMRPSFSRLVRPFTQSRYESIAKRGE